MGQVGVASCVMDSDSPPCTMLVKVMFVLDVYCFHKLTDSKSGGLVARSFPCKRVLRWLLLCLTMAVIPGRKCVCVCV